MHPDSSATGGRYIIRSGDSALLAALICRIQADTSIALLDVIGPSDAPHTVVVGTSPEVAAALEMQFRSSNQFTIEPDRPLSLFGAATGSADPYER